MKKKIIKSYIIAALIFLLFVMTGCEESQIDVIELPKKVETEIESNQKSDQDTLSNVEGIIENQTFEIFLDDWGKVTFASLKPKNNSNQPHFVLIKNEEMVYEFPETDISSSDSFLQVSGVKFTDFNMDGKKDILVLVQYSYGKDIWNVPIVFLQEFSDNMIYLDYPDLESYKIEAYTENGVPFYRDTLLEEYISKQHLTETLSDVQGIWPEYIENLEALFYQRKSIKAQIEIFAQERTKWAVDLDFGDEKYCFTLADLDMDGSIEMIVSNYGGTGFYTYSHFFKIGDDGKMKELETTFTEGDSQPDMMDEVSNEEDMTIFSYITDDGERRNNFIAYDYLKAPDSYTHSVSSLAVIDDVVTETKLASQLTSYEGEDYVGYIMRKDYSGKELTEAEYNNYPITYYEALNAEKHTAHFEWKNISDIEEISHKDLIKILTESYEKYIFR